MGGTPKNSIQWELLGQALSLMFDVADGLGIRGFFSVPEGFSVLKSLVHSIVAAEVEHELGLRNWYVRTLVGNICAVASSSYAPPAMLNDLQVLLLSVKNQLKAVKT